MSTIKTMALSVTAAAVLSSSAAFADCGIKGNANVSILGNDFPALHAVFSAAEQCAGNGVTVTKNHNKDWKQQTSNNIHIFIKCIKHEIN